MINQKGYTIKMVLIVFALIIGLMVFPIKFPPTLEKEEAPPTQHYCRDFINDPNAPVVEAPSYDGDQVFLDSTRKYRLIKAKVPIYHSFFVDQDKEHFFNDYKEPYTDPAGRKFIMRLPKGEQGNSYKLPSEQGENFLHFADYGLLYLFYTSNGVDPDISETIDLGNGDSIDAVEADIYKAVDMRDLPEWVLKCIDVGLAPALGTNPTDQPSKIIVPAQEVSPDKEQLQLEWFLLNNSKLQLQAWWTPHCKPAVYLYPPKKQLVNVRVYPKGELSYTDPPYDPEKGWVVLAYPDGQLLTINDERITNNYLYYESKIRDEEIEKPKEGWVVKFDELENLYQNILPKLGLNEKQTADFIEYWIKALPEASYYFVGIIDQENVNEFEKLEITPKPDSINRVRIYFERLDVPKAVETPVIQAMNDEQITNNGFEVVEWGGMVKNDPNHPFTCSQ